MLIEDRHSPAQARLTKGKTFTFPRWSWRRTVWTQLGMDHEAKILLPDSNGTHWVSKSNTGWKFGLKFSCQTFSSLLTSKMSWSNHVSLRLSPSLSQGCNGIPGHSADGFPRARSSVIAQRNSSTGPLHPRSSLVERTCHGKILALVLWNF